MTSRLLSFPVQHSITSGWSNAELAELYRVEHALIKAGIQLETERGVTEEGDPWFVFCRDNGDVLVHIARLDGRYHLYSPALAQPMTGTSFSSLTRSFIGAVPVPPERSARVVLHPAALLSVLVLTIFYSADILLNKGAHAAELNGGSGDHGGLPATGSSDTAIHLGSSTVLAEKCSLKAAFGAHVASLNAGRHDIGTPVTSTYMMLVTSVIGFTTLMHERAWSLLLDDAGGRHPSSGNADRLPSLKTQAERHEASNGSVNSASPDDLDPAVHHATLYVSNAGIVVRPNESGELRAFVGPAAPVPGWDNIATDQAFFLEGPFASVARAAAEEHFLSSTATPMERAVKSESSETDISNSIGSVELAATANNALDPEGFVGDANGAIGDGGTSSTVTHGVGDATTTTPAPAPLLSMSKPLPDPTLVTEASNQLTEKVARVDSVVSATLRLSEEGRLSYQDILRLIADNPEQIDISNLNGSDHKLLQEMEGIEVQTFDTAAKIKIESFLGANRDAEIIFSDGSIIIYDPDAAPALDRAVLSWDLEEGGTISIIGHLHAPIW